MFEDAGVCGTQNFISATVAVVAAAAAAVTAAAAKGSRGLKVSESKRTSQKLGCVRKWSNMTYDVRKSRK